MISGYSSTRRHRQPRPKVGSWHHKERIWSESEGTIMLARLGLSMCLVGCLVSPASATTPATHRQAIEFGRTLAQAHCATCHAIGKRGQSPNPQAPRFATLAQRYPLDNLAEAFSEGILVGHGPMPEFQFEPDQVDSLIAYLRSVQSPIKKAKKRASK